MSLLGLAGRSTNSAFIRKLAIVSTLASLLGACVQEAPDRPSGTQARQPDQPRAKSDLTVSIPTAANRPILYTWKGADYDNRARFISTVEADVAAAVDRVPSTASQPLGRLRVILPERTLSATITRSTGRSEDAMAAVRQAREAIDAGKVRALRRALLFDSITTEIGNVDNPPPDSNDYIMWFAGGDWYLRYYRGDPENIFDSTDIATWERLVETSAKKLKEQGKEPGHRFTSIVKSNPPNTSIRYIFNGLTYTSTALLVSEMRQDFLKQGREVPTMPGRLGGRLKVILTTDRGITTGTLALQNPEVRHLQIEADQGFKEAIEQGRIEALRQSHIFDEVVVESATVRDVTLDGFDHALWEPAGTPLAWQFRSRAGDGERHGFVSPAANADMVTWVAALRDQMRRPAPGK